MLGLVGHGQAGAMVRSFDGVLGFGDVVSQRLLRSRLPWPWVIGVGPPSRILLIKKTPAKRGFGWVAA